MSKEYPLNDMEALSGIVGGLAANLAGIRAALEQIAAFMAPAGPSYKRPIGEYLTFDWSSIGAEVVKSDEFGPSVVEWNGKLWTRRSPENKFGEAIWFSAPAGKDADGNVKYDRLITFKPLADAEPISRGAERQIAAGRPAAQPATGLRGQAPAETTPPPPKAQPAAEIAGHASQAEAVKEFEGMTSRGEELKREAAAQATGQRPAAVSQPQLPGTARPNSAAGAAEVAKRQAAEQAATTAGKPPRPWSTAKVLATMKEAVEWARAHPAQIEVNGKYGATLGLLDKILPPYDHHDLIEKAFGVRSAHDLSAEQKWALAKWADPRKDAEGAPWYLPDYVQQEFRDIVCPTPF